jgi:hypothetical protein
VLHAYCRADHLTVDVDADLFVDGAVDMSATVVVHFDDSEPEPDPASL